MRVKRGDLLLKRRLIMSLGLMVHSSQRVALVAGTDLLQEIVSKEAVFS